MKNNTEFDNYTDLDVDGNGLAITSEFTMDGATTLSEAADMIRAYADYLEDLEGNGYQLANIISQGRGYANLEDDSELVETIF